MPLDPRIPLEVQAPNITTPLQSVGALMQMRSQLSELALRQAQAEQARAQTANIQAVEQQRQRDLQDQQKVTDLLRDPINQKSAANGDFTFIHNAGVNPTVADPVITNFQKWGTTALANQKSKNEQAVEGRTQLAGIIEGLDPKDDEVAAAQLRQATQHLAQEHPELAAQLTPPSAGPDFRAQIKDLAASNGIAQAILDKTLAVQKEKATVQNTESEIALRQDQAREARANAAIHEAELGGATQDWDKAIAAAGLEKDIAKSTKAAIDAEPLLKDKVAALRAGIAAQTSRKTTMDSAIMAAKAQASGLAEAARLQAQTAGISGGPNGEPSTAAQMIAEYQIPYAQGVARLPAQAREVLDKQIRQINPSFQASNFQTYQNTEKDATTGKMAVSASALNTMMGHLAILNQAADALKNGDIQLINKIANGIGAQTGSSAKTTYETIVHRLGPEITKAYVASGGSVGERGTNEEDFSASLSPAQIKANIGVSAQLADSKIKAIQDQYSRGTYGKGKQQFISPEAEAARQQLAGQSPVKNIPTPISQSEYDALPKGSRFHKPNDPKVYIK